MHSKSTARNATLGHDFCLDDDIGLFSVIVFEAQPVWKVTFQR